MSELPLQDYWDALSPPDSERRASHRPDALRSSWEPPDIDRLTKWSSVVGLENSKPLLLIEGPTPAHRASIYRLTKTVQAEMASKWLERGLVANLTDRVAKVRAVGSIIPHEWDLLWNLLTLEQLDVVDPVRSLIDQGDLFTQAFKAIWEARFRLDEGRELQTFVSTLSRWMTASELTRADRELLGSLGIENELETTFERLDLLFFLVTLARQNELIYPTVFVFDGLERMVTQGTSKRKASLKEFYDFCLTAERWGRLGSPLGFMLGYSNEHDALEVFEKSNAKLGEKLRKYASV
jgi:hypothetical protein